MKAYQEGMTLTKLVNNLLYTGLMIKEREVHESPGAGGVPGLVDIVG